MLDVGHAPGLDGRNPPQHLARSVRRPVVHDDEIEPADQGAADREHSADAFADQIALVEHGHDDGQVLRHESYPVALAGTARRDPGPALPAPQDGYLRYVSIHG